MSISKRFHTDIYWGSLYQLFIVFLFFWSTRLFFIFHNAVFIDVTSVKDVIEICLGGLRIDACIMAYSNSLFILMRFAPWPWVYRRGWITASNLLLCVVNSLLIIINLADTAYFPFTGYRMSWQGFLNVMTDSGTLGLLLSFAVRFWWIYLFAVIFLVVMVWLILRVRFRKANDPEFSKSVYWILRSAIFVVVGGITFMSMRGWTSFHDRPIERATGVAQVKNIKHFSAVLNSPFSILFSRKGDVTIERVHIFPESRLRDLRCDIVRHSGDTMNRKNVMVIVIESGGSIHSKVFNPVKGDSAYNRSLSFVDSLAKVSLINRRLVASGRTSAQGITHIFMGIPYFGSSYLVESPYVGHTFDSPARLLGQEGYNTRFYYGCAAGNYHIDETMRLSGFQTVKTRESFGDDSQFDGKWGIWDLPMSEFVIDDISASYDPLHPFFATWFTITAHEPNIFPNDEDLENYVYSYASPERSMEYTDRALRHFFQLAQKQPWYEDTIFVITSDHGQRNYSDFHTNDIYAYSHLPLIIFTPDSSIAPAIVDVPMSQIDLASTIMDLIGYDKPYISMGSSLFDTTKPHYGLAEAFGRYYVFGERYLVSFSGPGKPAEEVFDMHETPLPKTPLKKYDPAAVDSIGMWFGALMQDFTNRINDDNLQYKPQSKQGK